MCNQFCAQLHKEFDPIVSRLVFIVSALPLAQQTDDRSDSFGHKDHSSISKKEMLLIDDSDNLEFLQFQHICPKSVKNSVNWEKKPCTFCLPNIVLFLPHLAIWPFFLKFQII
jgi:hypothetical protein